MTNVKKGTGGLNTSNLSETKKLLVKKIKTETSKIPLASTVSNTKEMHDPEDPAKNEKDPQKLIEIAVSRNDSKALQKALNIMSGFGKGAQVSGASADEQLLKFFLSQDKRGNTLAHEFAKEPKKIELLKILVEEPLWQNLKNNRWDYPLVEAIVSRNEEAFDVLVEKSIPMINHKNAKFDSARTFLHFAVQFGTKSMVKKLIEKGADLLAKNAKAQSVFHLAAEKGDLGILKILLDALQKQGKSVDKIDTPDEDGNRPLLLAAKHGHSKLLEPLANVRSLYSYGEKERNNAFHLAAMGGHVETFKELFLLMQKNSQSPKYGVRNLLLDRNTNKNNIFHLAAANGHTNFIREISLFLARNEFNQNTNQRTMLQDLMSSPSENRKSVLYTAIEADQCDAAKQLVEIICLDPVLKEEVDLLNQENSEGVGALSLSVIKKQPDLVDLLLNSGVSVLPQNKYNKYPLQLAIEVEGDDHPMVASLLQHGASLTFAPKNGKALNAFHCAAAQGKAKMLAALLRGDFIKVSLNSENPNGERALELALDSSSPEQCVKLLIESGAVPDFVTKDGMLFLNKAIRKKNKNIINTLLASKDICLSRTDKYGGKTPLHTAIEENDYDTAYNILENENSREKLLRSTTTQGGYSALHLATKSGSLELVSLLLSKGAELNCQSGNEGTALDIAEREGHTLIAELLKSRGARNGLSAG